MALRVAAAVLLLLIAPATSLYSSKEDVELLTAKTFDGACRRTCASPAGLERGCVASDRTLRRGGARVS
jgi:hypothetical protein